MRLFVHPADHLDALLWGALRMARQLRLRAPLTGELLRKLVLVVWWTLSLQLHMQFRYWLRARRNRRCHAVVAVIDLVRTVDLETLALPKSDTPLVSIIIPVHGQLEMTLRCLQSIVRHAPAAAIEVIVADDAGPEQEWAVLQSVPGLVLLRNDRNAGFIRTCNHAAQTARGTYLLFLNNDTQALPGWLDAMLQTFEQHAHVGAVGAKLLYPDGSLQEAGGIIWRDGSGWNFGRHDDPARPVYNYVREVDYCSGAALMVPRALFQRLNGFEQRYIPAYFEDSDLCFRLREMGLRTLYQPRAAVVHLEGVSHGTDLGVGIKSYQVTNRRTFVRTWRTALARDHYANGEHIMRARDRARHKPIVLVIDHQVPRPDRDAGSRTIDCFIRALLDAGMVVKFWPQNHALVPGYTEALQDLGVEVFGGPSQVPLREWLRENGGDLDHVLLSRPDVAIECLDAVRQHSKARVTYYGHDLHFMRMRLQGEVDRDESLLRAADRMEEQEREIWLRVDGVLYPSEDEAAMVRGLEPAVAAQAVQPYGFDRFGVRRAPPPGRDILFVAGFGHPPNEQALRWFVEAILPLVRGLVPDVRLLVAGSNPSAWVSGLACERVVVTGNVPDAALRALYAGARAAAVPLLSGAGVKLKVVEALREGLPLVTTAIGAQGLPQLRLVADVTDDPTAFARALAAVLLDDALWQDRCAAQLAYAADRFGRDRLRRSLLAGMTVRDCAAAAAVARYADQEPMRATAK